MALACLLLVCFAAAVQPRALHAAAPAPSFKWLTHLQGHCWAENAFHAEVCYWSPSGAELYWLSRNHGGLLGCGKFAWAPGKDAVLDSISWESRRSERMPGQRLSDTELNVSDGSSMSRIDARHFQIVDHVGAPPLVFHRTRVFNGARSAHAKQCQKWETRLQSVG